MSARTSRVLITTDSVGGVWQYSLDLAEALVRHGCRPIVTHLGPPPTDAQREHAGRIDGLKLIETGLPLDWLCKSPGEVLDCAAAITRLAHDERVDLIHLNSPALAASSPSAIPVVAVAHGCLATWWAATRPGQPLPEDYQWHRRLCAEGLRAAVRVVAPTRAFARQVARTYGLSETPGVVHNGRRHAVPRRAVPDDCAFTAGRLWDDAKRIRVLDEAAARLAIPFHAAGPTMAPHGETIAPAHLHLLGVLGEEAMAQWLSRRPIFVSAASFEPFGLAVLEAAAAGCPLVLSDIPSFRELWEGVAVFVEQDDAKGYAWAIEAIVADPPSRRALADAASARAARYTPEALGAAMARLYASTINAATVKAGMEGRAA